MKPFQVGDQKVARFLQERERFKFVYRCPDCVHFDGPAARCSLGYPNRTLMESETFLEHGGRFVFCKYFELV